MNKNNTAPLGSAAAAQAAVPAELASYLNPLKELAARIKAANCRPIEVSTLAATAILDLIARVEVTAPAVPSPPLSEGLTDELRSLLKSARDYIDGMSVEPGYGFHRPANPHDFTPDAESCSAEEIAAHRDACEAYDRGEYTPERGSEWVGAMHILRAPWGIGTYVVRNEYAEKLIAEIDAQIARLSAPPSPTLHGAVGAEPVAEFADDFIFCLRKQPNGERWPVGTKLYVATPVATQSGAAAAPVDRNAVLEECRAVFDLMLDGCNDDKFGDFQNGHGEEIGPRMDALHARLRAMSPISAPDGGDERKETGE